MSGSSEKSGTKEPETVDSGTVRVEALNYLVWRSHTFFISLQIYKRGGH